MINKVFNKVAHILNYVPEQTEALTRKLLSGMKDLGIKTLNNAYCALEGLQPKEPAMIPVRSQHTNPIYRK